MIKVLSLVVPNIPKAIYTALQSIMDTVLRTGDDAILHPRAYQLEMLEESLKRNVIVAVRWSLNRSQGSLGRISNKHQMDTGSGKTNMHVLLGSLGFPNCG